MSSVETRRNFVIAGHSGSGKTTLCEAILLAGGAISRIGSIDAKSTVSDFMADEQEKQSSIYASVLNCKYNDTELFFVDTPGAHCGTDAERYGVGESIARNLFELSKLEVPVITVILGEGGSGGALAFAVSDRLAMLENSIYSILSPEGFASILWKDKSKAESASVLMKLTAQDALDHGIIDTIIPEPVQGAKKDDGGVMAKNVSSYIEKCIDELSELTTKKLLNERNKRFRDYGKKCIKKG